MYRALKIRQLGPIIPSTTPWGRTFLFLHCIEGKLRPRARRGQGPLDTQPWGTGQREGSQNLEGAPSHQVVTSAKDTVASGVTGVVGLARQSRRWSVELKRSVSHAVDVVLGKSEELVDHFLPMTEDELGEAGTLPPWPAPESFCPVRIPGGYGSEKSRTWAGPHSSSSGNTELEPRPDVPIHVHGPPTHILLEARPRRP